MKHPLDFVLHCLGAGFAEMRPHPISDVVDLLDHRGRSIRDGGATDCLAEIVGHGFSFQIRQSGSNVSDILSQGRRWRFSPHKATRAGGGERGECLA